MRLGPLAIVTWLSLAAMAVGGYNIYVWYANDVGHPMDCDEWLLSPDFSARSVNLRDCTLDYDGVIGIYWTFEDIPSAGPGKDLIPFVPLLRNDGRRPDWPVYVELARDRPATQALVSGLRNRSAHMPELPERLDIAAPVKDLDGLGEGVAELLREDMPETVLILGDGQRPPMNMTWVLTTIIAGLLALVGFVALQLE